jgi:hypothetical protein
VYKKTACQFQFKFTIDDYLQNVQNITTKYERIYNSIQTNLQASKFLKHICADTKLNKTQAH